MEKIPFHLKEYIFLLTDFDTSVKNNCVFNAKKLFNESNHGWEVSAENGDLERLKFLQINKIGKCSKKNYGTCY